MISTAYSKIRSTLRQLPWAPLLILFVFVFVGIFGRWIAPHDPLKTSTKDALTPPFWQEGGTTNYILGTDPLGRDILSRLICGSSISLEVGFIVIIVAGLVGAFFALLSGYFGGKIDALMMRIVDIFISLPYMMVALILAAVLGPSKNNIILVLVIVGWAFYARVLRSEVLRIKEEDFVRLAEVAGCSKIRIMVRHIFPGLVNTLVILSTLQLGIVIITEASLSFLGVGVPPPHPAWGSMVASGRDHIFGSWWICFWPGLAILLVVLSCNLLGDWLRVRLDPKFRQL